MNWGPINCWPVDRTARAVPSELKPGDWLLTDLMIRPHLGPYLPQLERRSYHRAFVWVFVNGEAFMLEAPGRNGTSHLVLSYYRVWRGEQPPRAGVQDTQVADCTRSERILEDII